ncbi:MAG: phage tail protein [Bryobacterales bacterium]|nr:phage tail protein [Bryobacterales bacterium]
MPTESLMTLGGYVFGTDSAAYDEMRRAAEYRWAAQDRIGRPPARQWLGPGGETVELSGTIYPVRRRAEEELAALRAEAAKGEPLRLMLGTGEILGLWTIERIQETGTVFLPGGVPRKVGFSVRLAWYGEDGES